MLAGGLDGPTALGVLLVTGGAVYLIVVVASNVTDLLVSFGWIQTSFRSGNLAFIEKATRIYFRSQPVDQALLAGVAIWEAPAAALLWYGAIAWYWSGPVKAAAAEAGLIVLALLWMAFATAAEVFVRYDRGVDESAYWALAIAGLAAVLTVVHLRRAAMLMVRPVVSTGDVARCLFVSSRASVRTLQHRMSRRRERGPSGRSFGWARRQSQLRGI